MNYETMWKQLTTMLETKKLMYRKYCKESDIDSIVYKVARCNLDLVNGIMGYMDEIAYMERDTDLMSLFYNERKEENDNVENN